MGWCRLQGRNNSTDRRGQAPQGISSHLLFFLFNMVGRTRSKTVSAIEDVQKASFSEPETAKEVPPGPRRGIGGPAAMKHVCFRCRKNKWIIDFKEGKAADLTRLSTCQFCELERANEVMTAKIKKLEQELGLMKTHLNEQSAQLQRLKEEGASGKESGHSAHSPSVVPSAVLDRLKIQDSRMTNLSRKMEALERAPRTVTRDTRGERAVASEKSPVSQVPPEGPSGKRKPRRRKKKKLTDSKGKDVDDGSWQVVGRRVAPCKGKPINLLVGDSLVGRQTSQRFRQLREDNRVLSFPGARIERVTREIATLELDRNSTLVVSVGGNDLFLNQRKSGSTEKIMRDFGALARAMRAKTNRGVVVGLVPRRFATREHYSKASWINRRLETLCRAHSLRFVKVWDKFFGKNHMFWRDGTHFSGRGSALFAEHLDSHLFKPLKETVVLRGEQKEEKTVKKQRVPRRQRRAARRNMISTAVQTDTQSSATCEGAGPQTPTAMEVSAGTAKRMRSVTVSPEEVVLKRPRTYAEVADSEGANDDRHRMPAQPAGDPDGGDDDGDPEDDDGGDQDLGNGQESGGDHGTSG